MISLSEEEFEALISKGGEDKNLDFKGPFKWDKSSRKEQLGIIKDILAMSNTQDGGKIIIGVRDTDYQVVGLSEDELESFDQTDINNLLHTYTDPRFSCSVQKLPYKGKNVVIIIIPEFSEVPIICKKNASTKNNEQILKASQIYMRTDKATSEAVSCAEDMRELLGRGLVSKKDELLSLIRRLIEGKPLSTVAEPEEYYKTELEQAEEFFDKRINNAIDENGSWKITVYPLTYYENRIKNLSILKELIEKNQVRKRGWYFPHIDNDNSSSFSHGRESYTISDISIEGFRAYQSGLFIWKGVYREDLRGLGENVLDFRNVIFSILEELIFLKRFYKNIEEVNELNLILTLDKTYNRKIVSTDRSRHLWGDYRSKEDYLSVKESFDYIDLESGYEQKTLEIAKRIFNIFNWFLPNETIEPHIREFSDHKGFE